MTLMRRLTLNFCHSQNCSQVKVRGSGLVLPMGFVTSGCSSSHAVTHDPGVMLDEYTWAPPHAHLHSGASSPVGPIMTAKSKWQ